MINIFISVLFVSIFSLEFFNTNYNFLPRFFTWVPEILSIFCVIIIFLSATSQKKFLPKKWFAYFIIVFVHILISTLLNGVPSEALFVGIRQYFKFIPFFILPFVVEMKSYDIKWQLTILSVLVFLQFPITLYQRLIQYGGMLTGDVVTGTFNGPSSLSVFLICSIAVLFGFYLKKKIRLLNFIFLLAILFIPTTLNETKGSLFLLPVAVCTILFFMREIELRKKVLAFMLCIVMIGVFIPVYDHFMRPRWGYGLIDFFMMEDRAINYLYTGQDADFAKTLGRGDIIKFAWQGIGADPYKLFFGVGLGNTAISYLEGFEGKYSYTNQLGSNNQALPCIIWEWGMLGLILYILFFFLLFQDVSNLKNRNDLFGSLSSGWQGVLVVIFLSMVYINYFHDNRIMYVFYYFSGVIAAHSANQEPGSDHKLESDYTYSVS